MSAFDLLELIYAQIIFLFRLFHSQFNANSVNLSDFNQNGWAMESIMEYNNNVANAWSSFFTSAQRQQYF